jgi:eukaryotic-like serine/threonine-protein kinase
MNSSTCPDCGASLKPGTPYCSACLLSAGQATEPTEPVSAGLIVLPCDFGAYRLLRKLGAGGMGVVYEAEERATGRRLALKVLRQAIDTEEQRKRFRREGRLAASINHPNSLYVFGTDEIEGVPVIATELADGGTLHDEVKRRGPLPIEDAVDAILSVLDGLEAAHRQGVHHRDMKPSNCFVSSDGVTKVGDYGLSISYSDDKPADDPLTRSGVIMGTPAFSPPEQLRGEALDQRTDIYSTAATLYYLLTGKPPVVAETSVGTVAAVLEGRIRPPHEHRPELPVNLSAAIMRGLATDKANRPTTHAAFRLSLAPFGSEAPQPAPLGLRLLAGVVDAFIISALISLFWMIPTVAAMTSESQILWVNLGTTIAIVLGYTLVETRTGATPGKRLFRLQVLGHGGALPAWRPCLLRSSLFGVCSGLINLVPWRWVDAGADAAPTELFKIMLLLGLLLISNFQLALFLPSLRRKDRAAWHDLASGLRVTCRRHSIARAALRNAVPKCPVEEGGPSWGGLIVGDEISEGLRWAHDPLLQRPLLLRRRSDADAAPGEARRFCARPGRLRWHHTVSDSEAACWDVWQAIPGQPLSDLLVHPSAPSWDLVLPWLRDLAAEMDAAQKDGTLPAELTSKHIWITQSGHAVLLDEAWPGTPEPLFQTQDPQEFLACVAGLAEAATRPIHADRVMNSLQRRSFERLSHAAGTFTHLQQLPSTVNRAKRAACLLAPMVTAILLGLILSNVLLATPHEWRATFPGQTPLPEVMQLHLRQTKVHGTDHPLKEAIRQHVAGHYGAWVRDHGVDSLPANPWDLFGDELQIFVTEQISDGDAINEAALESADGEIRRALEQNPSRWRLKDLMTTEASQVAAVFFVGCAICIGLCQFISILALGSPLLMHLGGVTVISEKKRPASRARIVWRWCLGWGIMLLFSVPATVFAVVMPEKDPSLRTSEHAVILLLPLVVILLLSSLLPMLGRRSLVDRLARTWLVAR